ncbi:PREDICTED: bZIP transcription factor 44-like isoform X2 [Lupinus angustifolius]|uniref:bZIP transcription factor 44-like isoform X2 n=1 Tax=Lupinus angustifolius TaxID=3871 RepID=UPI00092E7D0C|nr:PREDICTED: bZIP transcription factor 44-like isoform X2 [Lupinus angustifolius]
MGFCGSGISLGCDEELKVVMDERKRKRMISNRESARRSRMKKVKHFHDLSAKMAQLTNQNHQLLTTLNHTTQRYFILEAQNSVLKAQVAELSHRLHSLNHIMDFASRTFIDPALDNIFNPFNVSYMNQPIIASAEAMLQY